MLNLAAFLDAAACRQAEATAVLQDDRRYSYGQLRDLCDRVAHGLREKGFGPKDRIALCCSNRVGFLAAYFGALKVGAGLALLSTTLKARDIEFQLRDSCASAFFVFDGFGDTAFAQMAIEGALAARDDMPIWIIPADPLAKSPLSDYPSLADLMADGRGVYPNHGYDAAEAMLFLYTSGSTGRPKGVVLNQLNLLSMALINGSLAPREDTAVRLVVTPLYHIAGQMAGMAVPILAGETMVLVERFDPQAVWRAIAATHANYFFQMPIYYQWLLEHAQGVDLKGIGRHLRVCVAGGSPLPGDWAEDFHGRLGVPIRQCYGMTEVTSTVTWNGPERPWRPDRAGHTVPGVEIELRDPRGRAAPFGEDGEIYVRSPGNMMGYHNLPKLSAEVLRDGWYRTKDIGRVEPDGSLKVLGRADDKIKRGEEHIYPAEVETVLLEHPLVRQAAVVAVPDPYLGQEAKTFVVLEEGADLASDRLLAWLGRELPAGKCPGVIEYQNALPMTATGKVARHLLA